MKSVLSRGVATPESLLARFRDTGDPAALAALFDRTAPALFRVALAVAPDAATAEEAVQETFLAVLEDPGRCDPSEPVMPWLAGVLRHKVLDARRRARRVPDPLRLDPRILPEDPADAVARRDAVDRVRAALNRLEEPYRSVALLRWEYGLEPGEIAHARGEPPGTVRSTLSRALERLRKDLGGVVVLGIVLGMRPPSGLATIRRTVLARAGVEAGAVVAGGVLVTGTAATLALAASFVAGGLLGGGISARLGERDAETVPIEPLPVASAPPPREEPPPAVPGPAPAAAPGTDAAPATMAHRLLDGLDGTWFSAWKIGGLLARAEPAPEVLEALRARWPALNNVVDRQNVMKGYAFSLSGLRLEVIDLGYRDPDPRVRSWACNYLAPYADRRFDDDPAAYGAWRASVAGIPPEDLLVRSADRLLGILRASAPGERRDLLELLDDVVLRLRPDSAARGPVLDAAEAWLADPAWIGEPSPLLRLLRDARPGEERARALLDSLLVRGGEAERRALLLAGRLRAAWASDALIPRLRSAEPDLASAAAGALADIEDPRAVGPLVEALVARGGDGAAPDLAAALARLADVPGSDGRDGAWWWDWWSRNRARLEVDR